MSLDVYLIGGATYEANYTHNMIPMAEEVGLYEPLWRPEELDITHARHLILPLSIGLRRLIDEKEHLLQFNPKNGWGDYDGFVEFVADYLAACERFPGALVEVSR